MKFVAFSILLVSALFFRSSSAESTCTVDADCLNGGACNYPEPDTTNATVVKCNNGQLSCYFGGTCLKPWVQENPTKHWKCKCPEGRSGDECENDESLYFARCDCPPEFRGTHCADECACQNGGTCAKSNEDGSEICECPHGYIGAFCEVQVNVCNDGKLKCLYGGKCLKPWTNNNPGPRWICECPGSRTGPECESEALPTSSASDGVPTSSTSDGVPTSSTSDDVPTNSTSNGGAGGFFGGLFVIFGLVLVVSGIFRKHKAGTKSIDTATSSVKPYSDGIFVTENATNDTAFADPTPPPPDLLNVDIDSKEKTSEKEIV